MNGLFITGTDTDVGKTAVSALLLAELRRRNQNIAPMKPAQTGCKKTGTRQQAIGNRGKATHSCLMPHASCLLSVPDLDYSLAMAEMTVSKEDYDSMSPYRFEPACSPHLAAELAETEVEIAEIVIAARTLAKTYDFILAEGAGGIMVPLNRREMTLDLMHALGFPVLLAARPGLGTINHTLLSIRTLRADGLNIAGVVIVETDDSPAGFIEADNLKTIEQCGNVPILGKIPYCAQLKQPDTRFSDLPIRIKEEAKKIVDQLNL